MMVLPAKRTSQELCRLRFSWDEVIPTKFAQQWFDWIKDLQGLVHLALMGVSSEYNTVSPHLLTLRCNIFVMLAKEAMAL